MRCFLSTEGIIAQNPVFDQHVRPQNTSSYFSGFSFKIASSISAGGRIDYDHKKTGRSDDRLCRAPLHRRARQRRGQKGGGRSPGRQLRSHQSGRQLWRKKLGEGRERHAEAGSVRRAGQGQAKRQRIRLYLCRGPAESMHRLRLRHAGTGRAPFWDCTGPALPWRRACVWRRLCWTAASGSGRRR